MKKYETKNLIEQNKDIILNMISGTSFKRLNTLNWLRYELSNEAKTLFHLSTKDQKPYLDYSSIKNLGEAWDYILENQNQEFIDTSEIRVIHSILCQHTPIDGGIFRTTNKYIEIYVNNSKMRAPDYQTIETSLNQIIYKLNNPKHTTLTNAFNAHYDLIALQPFDDFNKRMARMIMNWIIIRAGYSPIIFNHKQDKLEYISALSARAHGDIKSYSKYLYNCMLRTQKSLIKSLQTSKII